MHLSLTLPLTPPPLFASSLSLCHIIARTRTQALLHGQREGVPFFMMRVERGPELLSQALEQLDSARRDGSMFKPLRVCGLLVVTCMER